MGNVRKRGPCAALQRTMEGQRTCQTAPNVVFESVEELKAHYKSDWHRYNLKRKARKARGLLHAAAASRDKRARAGGRPAYGWARVV